MEKPFDIAIIGAGASGLQLALQLAKDDFFSNHQILIVERSDQQDNDKTWCFWEVGAGDWDDCIFHQWEKGQFIDEQATTNLSLEPYRYKMLRAIDFYKMARKKLSHSSNIQWVKDEVKDLTEANERIKITTAERSYHSNLVFDSRIPEAFFQSTSDQRLLQHFQGWFIETETDVFDPQTFVMMDYRYRWKNSCSFTYVLPTSPRHALVEFTLFNQELLKEEDYQQMLNHYLNQQLKGVKYNVQSVESGIIPMSDYAFRRHHQSRIIKIGTAGGWVRPSSGYSFRNSSDYIQQLIKNLKAEKVVHKGVANNRFRLYDRIFLDVLIKHNEMGPELFASMYRKNHIHQIFRFLDEQSNWAEDFRLLNTFPKAPFIAALGRQIISGRLFNS